MITTHLISAITLGVDPIRIATPGAAQGTAPSSTPFPWITVGAIIVGIAVTIALGVLVVASIGAYRRIRALHPHEQAFRGVCRTLRIPPALWPELRALARKIDAAPVALLISRTAFERAVGTGSRSAELSPALDSIRSRLFGDDPAS